MKVNENEFGNEWKPVCMICQHMTEKGKEPPLDDDDCECRLVRKKPRPEDIRFWCTQDEHLKLNFITGEKFPVPCMEWNSHGACREFEAETPSIPVITVNENTITLELPLGSRDGTVMYYRIKPLDFADAPEQELIPGVLYEQPIEIESIPWVLYEQPIEITGNIMLEYVAVLANSQSEVMIKVCNYTAP
jgi:hypothetical protein